MGIERGMRRQRPYWHPSSSLCSLSLPSSSLTLSLSLSLLPVPHISLTFSEVWDEVKWELSITFLNRYTFPKFSPYLTDEVVATLKGSTQNVLTPAAALILVLFASTWVLVIALVFPVFPSYTVNSTLLNLLQTFVLSFSCPRALASFPFSYQFWFKILLNSALRAFQDISRFHSHVTPSNQCSSQLNYCI